MSQKLYDAIDSALAKIPIQRALIERQTAMLRRLEWIEFNLGAGIVWQSCPMCRSQRTQGHAPSCELAALVGETK